MDSHGMQIEFSLLSVQSPNPNHYTTEFCLPQDVVRLRWVNEYKCDVIFKGILLSIWHTHTHTHTHHTTIFINLFKIHLDMTEVMQQQQQQQPSYIKNSGGFLGGPVAKTPSSQCRGPGFHPWSGSHIPHSTTKSLHATTKDPVCWN